MKGLETFVIGSLACAGLILVSTTIFYEVMAHSWVWLARINGRRKQILCAVSGVFIAHTLVVWLFGISFYLLDTQIHFGDLKGADENNFFQYVYFSTVSYSSLGLGDVYPTGTLRLLMGVEGILGLILIGWSVGFTYLVTQQYLIKRSGRNHPLVKHL